MVDKKPITMKTKSGTFVYLSGNTILTLEKKRALDIFVKIYNKSFSTEEQKIIGNIIYDLGERKPLSLGRG